MLSSTWNAMNLMQRHNNNETKPQFYFGQNGHDDAQNDGYLKPSSRQTAIDKVKTNEAVSHPKNILVNPGYRIKDYVDPTEKSGKPSYAFGETPVVRKSSSAANRI